MTGAGFGGHVDVDVIEVLDEEHVDENLRDFLT